jgi:hypothetical protein
MPAAPRKRGCGDIFQRSVTRIRDEALKLFLQNLLDSQRFAFMWGLGRLLVGSYGLIGRLSLSVAPACRHLGFLIWLGRTA